MNPVEKAVETVGGVEEFRKLFLNSDSKPISRQAVEKWMTGRVPAERVLSIELHTGVSRHELRPDIYPPEVA